MPPDIDARPRATCESCGKETSEPLQAVQGQDWCQECIDGHASACAWCDELIPEDNSFTVQNDSICERCYENTWACSNCDNAFSEITDSYEHHGDTLCESCYHNREREGFHEFSGKRELAGSGRKIGVEIEVSGQTQQAHSQIDADGKWTAVEDGSVPDGIEYNSPILHESNYEAELTQFCRQRLDHADVDKHCGLHIHLDCADLSWWELANVFRYCRRYQDYFFSLVPASRRHNGYCLRLPAMAAPKRKAELVEFLYGTPKQRDIKANKYPHPVDKGCVQRYFWVNIHSYFYRRTLEFRLHSGTRSAEKIINWVKLLLAVLQNARQGEKAWKHPYRLMDAGLKQYWTARRNEFKAN